jgi:hypothetical protein
LAKRILPNETWVIVPVIREQRLHIYETDHFVLKGYHSNTKEMLHEYGPFDTKEELLQFAQERLITLTTGT